MSQLFYYSCYCYSIAGSKNVYAITSNRNFKFCRSRASSQAICLALICLQCSKAYQNFFLLLDYSSISCKNWPLLIIIYRNKLDHIQIVQLLS